MLTYKIHLIRHGLTQANLDGCYIGSRTDLPLCPQGRQQLEELRESWEYPFVDRVYTSPLLRAKETAEILFPDRLLETVDNLRELDFGEFEGRSAAELEKDPAFQKWISSPASACPPKGESGEQLQKRAVQAVAYIFGQMMEKKIPSVAVVTHGGLITQLLAAMGLPQREAIRWNTAPGHGYTLLLSAQMWMRDHKFEVYEQIPYPPSQEDSFVSAYWQDSQPKESTFTES